MLFRVVLISLVLGATTVLYWLSNSDLTAPNSLVIFGIITTTYVLTIVYAVLLQRGEDPTTLGYVQLGVDLVIASVLVHVTGGAQSAYTFFFPLAIIGGATVRYREGAITIAIAAAALFLIVSVAGWLELLPLAEGQRMQPNELSAIELGRALGLNLAGMVGVAFLAINLGGQLQRTSASLESHRSAAADLLTLHQDIVRSLASGLVTVDERDEVLTINRAACEILGVKQSAALGAPLEELFPGLTKELEERGESGKLSRAELSLSREQRDLVVGISVSPLFDHREQSLGRVVHFQDLTEMKEMEADMKKAERLAVIGGLAAGIAHEIRNPLASISGSIELLRQTPQADEDSDALMGIVTREIDRLNALINDLLDYTNPRPLNRTDVDLVELIQDTLRVFEQDRSFSGVSVHFTEEPKATSLIVSADPEKIRQMLWNLLRNAAEAASATEGNVTLRLFGRDDAALLEVEDDGRGIPPENLDRVFDPFFTTKSRGSGLGLASVHAIVRDHGGRIAVESSPGEGSRFRVHLPYTEGHGP